MIFLFLIYYFVALCFFLIFIWLFLGVWFMFTFFKVDCFCLFSWFLFVWEVLLFGCYLSCLVGLSSIACLKFCLSVSFSYFFSLLSVMHGLWALGSPARSQAWASVVRVISPRQWTTREFLAPGNINWCEFSQSFPSWNQDPATPN